MIVLTNKLKRVMESLVERKLHSSQKLKKGLKGEFIFYTLINSNNCHS